MKNKLWLIAIIALISLFMAACGEDELELGTEDNPNPLTNGTWEEGTLADASSEVWYSFTVVSGTTYYVWTQDRFSDGTPSGFADVRITAKYEGGDIIFEGSEAGTKDTTSATASTPKSDFVANKAGTVLLRVYPALPVTPGTFKVAFTTTNSRPGSSGQPSTPNGTEVNPFPLTSGAWLEGSVTNKTDEIWYSFSVTSGTYHVWVKDYMSSSVTIGDAAWGNVVLSAKYAGETTYLIQNSDSGDGTTSANFTASKSGTVLIKVQVHNSEIYERFGNFKVTFSTSASRPSGE